jgi:hypothetical protein
MYLFICDKINFVISVVVGSVGISGLVFVGISGLVLSLIIIVSMKGYNLVKRWNQRYRGVSTEINTDL